MSFAEFMNDTFDLLKQNGEKHYDIKALFDKSKIHMNNTKIFIEPGDIVQRKLSNGGIETYKVIDPHFHEGLGSIDSFYEIDVQKLGVPEAKQAIHNITYNINSTNTKINQNSIDNSINISIDDSEVLHLINKLKKEIIDQSLTTDEKDNANEIIDGIEAEFKSEKPKKSIIKALLSSLPTVGDIASISSLILTFIK